MIDVPKPEKEVLEGADREGDDGFKTEIRGKAAAEAVMQSIFLRFERAEILC
jgi:hypothetical protein